MTSLYLASGSPRRQELLTQLGVAFERIVTGIEEKRAEGESAQQYVSRLAREKALAGVAQGVQVVRVHDVPETRQALRLWQALNTDHLEDEA